MSRLAYSAVSAVVCGLTWIALETTGLVSDLNVGGLVIAVAVATWFGYGWGREQQP